MKSRSLLPEIMDQPNPPPEVSKRFHRDLKLIHRLMGSWQLVSERLKRRPRARSVIDIGCGDGALLSHIRENLDISEVTGVDLKPPECRVEGIPVVIADATRDALPQADTAISVMMLHHLTDEQVVSLLQNVGRSAERFVCLDLVRHPLPLILYTLFLCPLLGRVAAADGRQSIRRAFRSQELRALAERALVGTGARYEHWVSRFYARQILDIQWPTPRA